MTPAQMAAIHTRAFVHDRPWSAAEFTDLLAQPYTAAYTAPGGFALTRTLAVESELLTLAVDPAHQRRGVARSLLSAWLHAIESHAETAFLEVATDNAPAIALYTQQGFTRSGLRRAYYARSAAPAADALIMVHRLPQG